MAEHFPISNDVVVTKIMETSDTVVRIEENLKAVVLRQTSLENKLDDHDGRISNLEKAKHGDRRFVAGIVVVLSPIAALAVALAKQFFGL